MVHSLLQLSERWPCHIWLIGGMKCASLQANFDGGWGIVFYLILLLSLTFSLSLSLSLSLSGRSLNMTEILLTGTLSLNSINHQKPADLELHCFQKRV